MITQAEADSLIAMSKQFAGSATIILSPGIDESYDLIGDDKHERFLLDVWRGTLRLTKYKYQNRARTAIVLVRLDIDGSPHTNPNGQKIGGTHIHVYREGFETRWAFPLDRDVFHNLTNPTGLLTEFCGYCNIQNLPPIQEELA